MLIFSLLLLGFVFLRESDGVSLTYILKRQGTKVQPSCIAEDAERYAAIGWIYPMPKNQQAIPNITTKFIPTIHNEFNCKFLKNELCNSRWSIKNWKIDDSSERTTDFLDDGRWEDCRTIFMSKNTKEFKDSVEIPNAFKLGFSVRASGSIELFVCTGWNPYNYPCYYITVKNLEIFLQKYDTLPKNITTFVPLDSYRAFANILPENEWRNFVISLDQKGKLSLIDVNVNRTVIEYRDSKPLKPMYFLMRSQNASLWKIHQNNFMYSTSPQISRLGPQLSINSRDLCVSLYVSTCSYCEMTFFFQNGTSRKILNHVEPTRNKWINIKLKQENVQVDRINLFMEAKFSQLTNETSGFWAIDDVRVCNENEVKVTFLKLNNSKDDDYISCQLITKPNWRPKKLEYNEIKDFPDIKYKLTNTAPLSAKLTWSQEDPQNRINYFISYQANDICLSEPYNIKRLKSNGFLMTKYNEITIENLVPYTLYNITVSTVLHEKDKELFFNTPQEELPTVDELPNKVQIRTSDTVMYISWEKIVCTKTYGHLFYSLNVSNDRANFTKVLIGQTENNYEIDGLQPFTKYNLKISTARSVENLKSGLHTVNLTFDFFTLAGVASTVQNLELYSIDQNSASLRYDLPKFAQGIPSLIQINRCNALSFKKCKSYIYTIERCKLWPTKYCADVRYLIPNQEYSLKVSLKNKNTNSFGQDVLVSGYTAERVPGAPSNITYKFVDCRDTTDFCHLNVSWLHPYYPNGTITAFHVILNSTNIDHLADVVESIHEVYKVMNKTYQSTYTYQIKYVPYSKQYNLFLQSANSKFTSTHAKAYVKTSDIGDHINQSPRLLGKHDTSVLFELPQLDRRLDLYNLLVVVQDFDQNVPIDKRGLVQKVVDNLCHNFGNIWLSHNITISTNETKTINVGSSGSKNEGEIQNPALKPKMKYCFTFIVTNKYKKTEHYVVYYEKLETAAADVSGSSYYSHLYILLVLLLLVPIGFLIYRYVKKRKSKPVTSESAENEYETLPFEECEDNFVNNQTYDQLLHK